MKRSVLGNPAAFLRSSVLKARGPTVLTAGRDKFLICMILHKRNLDRLTGPRRGIELKDQKPDADQYSTWVQGACRHGRDGFNSARWLPIPPPRGNCRWRGAGTRCLCLSTTS